jgi:DNA modification methylase
MIFADPPFNLRRNYRSKINDSLSEEEYLVFQKSWILECSKKIRDGGSFYSLSTNTGDHILDHFLGSGNTLAVAKNYRETVLA